LHRIVPPMPLNLVLAWNAVAELHPGFEGRSLRTASAYHCFLCRMCGFDVAAAVYISSNARPQMQYSGSLALHNLILLLFTATQPESLLPYCGIWRPF
jgi:hypothetical protein